MAWVRAELRGQQVFARADAKGSLLSEGGRVEVRYRANDGRMYRAAARNLQVVDPTPLPDEHCGPAAPAEKTGLAAALQPGSRAPASSRATATPEAAPAGAVIVYADGACSGNPGPAGLGVVIDREGERIERYEYLGVGTNNVAELTAVLRALEEIEPGRATVVYTDSRYTIGVAQHGWKAKANTDLVASLRAAIARHGHVRLVHVPGHAGVPLNERADELARMAITTRKSERTVTKRATRE